LSDGGVQLVWSRDELDVEATFGVDDAELYIRTPEGELSVNPYDPEARTALGAILDQLRH
jgi:hypothetical protein